MKQWRDYPDTTTPLTAGELNRIEQALDTAATKTALKEATDDIEALVEATHDTGWRPLTRSTGWSEGQMVEARRVGKTVYVRGAAVRNSGGSLSSIATLPADMRPISEQSVGAAVATGNRQAELRVSTAGVIFISTAYTNITGSDLLTVPLAFSFLVD